MGLIQDAYLEGYAAGLRREPFTNPIPAWCEGYQDAKKGHTGRLQVALWARAREEEENARAVALENDEHWISWAEQQDVFARDRDAQRDREDWRERNGDIYP